MLDRPDHPYSHAGTDAAPAQPAPVASLPEQTVHSGVSVAGRSPGGTGRGVLARLGAVASVAGLAGGTVGTVTGGHSGSLVVPVLVVVASVCAVMVVMAVGFTVAMVRYAAEGRRQARTVGDVETLMSGTAAAYGRVFGSLTALVRGTQGTAAEPPQATGSQATRPGPTSATR